MQFSCVSVVLVVQLYRCFGRGGSVHNWPCQLIFIRSSHAVELAPNIQLDQRVYSCSICRQLPPHEQGSSASRMGV